MDEPIKPDSAKVPNRPDRPDWGMIVLKACFIVLAIAVVILFIKLLRRGGPGVALAMAAPAVAVASTRRKPKARDLEREESDLDFLKLWIPRVATQMPLETPAFFCEMLNDLARREGHAELFRSPMHMARELKKLGIKSSVRSVPGRSERRWYDLTEYAQYAQD